MADITKPVKRKLLEIMADESQDPVVVREAEDLMEKFFPTSKNKTVEFFESYKPRDAGDEMSAPLSEIVLSPASGELRAPSSKLSAPPSKLSAPPASNKLTPAAPSDTMDIDVPLDLKEVPVRGTALKKAGLAGALAAGTLLGVKAVSPDKAAIPLVETITTEEVKPEKVAASEKEDPDNGMAALKDFIKKEEGLELQLYPDLSRQAIGYGHNFTSDAEAAKYKDGITAEDAEKLLEADIKSHQVGLRRLKVPITQNQRTAMTSLAYNAGPSSINSIVDKLNEGDEKGAAELFTQYNKADEMVDDPENPGKKIRSGNKIVLPGLVSRRKKEKELFLTDGPMAAPLSTIERSSRSESKAAAVAADRASTSSGFDELISQVDGEKPAGGYKVDWTDADKQKYSSNRQELIKLYKEAKEQRRYAELAELLGHAMVQFFAASNGLKTGQDMSGLQFNKVDWFKKNDQAMDELKMELGVSREDEDGERKDVNSNRAALEKWRARRDAARELKAKEEGTNERARYRSDQDLANATTKAELEAYKREQQQDKISRDAAEKRKKDKEEALAGAALISGAASGSKGRSAITQGRKLLGQAGFSPVEIKQMEEDADRENSGIGSYFDGMSSKEHFGAVASRRIEEKFSTPAAAAPLAPTSSTEDPEVGISRVMKANPNASRSQVISGLIKAKQLPADYK